MHQKRISLWICNLHLSIKECYDCFSNEFVEGVLLPKMYLVLRTKPAGMEYLVEAMVMLVTREGSSSLMNAYTSKISVELCKSSKSYERETALLFFYFGMVCIDTASFYCSIELFQEYRLG